LQLKNSSSNTVYFSNGGGLISDPVVVNTADVQSIRFTLELGRLTPQQVGGTQRRTSFYILIDGVEEISYSPLWGNLNASNNPLMPNSPFLFETYYITHAGSIKYDRLYFTPQGTFGEQITVSVQIRDTVYWDGDDWIVTSNSGKRPGEPDTVRYVFDRNFGSNSQVAVQIGLGPKAGAQENAYFNMEWIKEAKMEYDYRNVSNGLPAKFGDSPSEYTLELTNDNVINNITKEVDLLSSQVFITSAPGSLVMRNVDDATFYNAYNYPTNYNKELAGFFQRQTRAPRWLYSATFFTNRRNGSLKKRFKPFDLFQLQLPIPAVQTYEDGTTQAYENGEEQLYEGELVGLF